MNKFIILLLMLFVTSVHADGNKLLDGCQSALNKSSVSSSNVDVFRQGFCYGMIDGVRGTLDMWKWSEEKPNLDICMPKKITLDKLISIVTLYLKKNTSRLNEDEFFLIIESFKKSFPCS